MQQTTIDRWLRKKFVYINRIYCNTLPKKVPFGVKVVEAPEESGGRYLYKLSTRSETLTASVAESLAKENISYTSRVEDRKVWFAKFLNDPNKSLTYRVAWVVIGLLCGVLLKSGLPRQLYDYLAAEEVPEEVSSLSEAVGDAIDNDARVFELREERLEMQDRLMEIDRAKEK